MTTARRERHDVVTTVSIPERFLRGDRQIVGASSATQEFRSLSIASPLLQYPLGRVPIPVPTAKGKDKFDGLADRLVSEEHSISRIRHTLFRSLARLESTVRDQLASIPGVMENSVVRLFDDAGWAMVSKPDTNVLAVIRKVVNVSVVKAFQSSASELQWKEQFKLPGKATRCR